MLVGSVCVELLVSELCMCSITC